MTRRKSSEAGTIGGAQFPILCNADLQRLDCHIDDNGISIRIFDKNGSEVRNLKIGYSKTNSSSSSLSGLENIQSYANFSFN